MQNSEADELARRRRSPARARTGLACLLLAGLAACAADEPTARHPVTGTVVRIIDAANAPPMLEPCLASRAAGLREGKRFAAIRYRHWASHFVSTVYAEVPSGMVLQVQQHLEIEPAKCSKDQLAVILGPAQQ